MNYESLNMVVRLERKFLLKYYSNDCLKTILDYQLGKNGIEIEVFNKQLRMKKKVSIFSPMGRILICLIGYWKISMNYYYLIESSTNLSFFDYFKMNFFHD